MTATTEGVTEFEVATSSAPRYLSKFICRVSGLPANAPSALVDNTLPPLLTRLWEVEQAIAAGRLHLSESLHTAIGSLSDKPTRNKLLGMRRSLFNDKHPSSTELSVAEATLDQVLVQQVLVASELLLEQRALVEALAQCYDEAVLVGRDRLRSALGDADFQAALALSSETLFRNLTTYRSSTAQMSGSRLEQIERGLLRYFTRMSTKATPSADSAQ